MVIDPAAACGCHCDGLGGDVGCRCCAGVDQAVVAGITARSADACNRHRLARAHVFVGKGGTGVGKAHRVATEHAAAGQCHPIVDALVIDPAAAGGCHRDGLSGDVGCCRCAGVDQAVVAGISTAQGNAADVDSYTCSHVLGCKCRSLCERHRVAADDVGRSCSDRGTGTCVIHSMGACVAGRQRFGCDIGCRCCAGVVQAVVAGITARNADACNRHRLGRAHVFVGKGGAGVEKVHRVAVDDAAAGQGHRIGNTLVINPVAAGGCHRDGLGGDVGCRCCAGVVQDVVACVTARNCADAGNRHRLGRAHVLVGKGGTGVGKVHRVAVDDAAAGQGHPIGNALVIDPVAASGCHRDGLGGDVGRGAGRRWQTIVAQHRASGCIVCIGQRHADRFADAHVFIGKGACSLGHRDICSITVDPTR